MNIPDTNRKMWLYFFMGYIGHGMPSREDDLCDLWVRHGAGDEKDFTHYFDHFVSIGVLERLDIGVTIIRRGLNFDKFSSAITGIFLKDFMDGEK
jgi:hypothetical protein